MVKEIIGKCPSCNSKQRHIVVKVKKDSAICKCSKCGSLHHLDIGEKEIMFIVSEAGKAKKIYSSVRNTLKKSDTITLNKIKYEIRSIEDEDGKHVDKCKPADIRTVWVQPYEKKFKISVHSDGSTKTIEMSFDKGKIISVGSQIETDNKRIEITRIITKDGSKETSKISDILSIYATPSKKAGNEQNK